MIMHYVTFHTNHDPYASGGKPQFRDRKRNEMCQIIQQRAKRRREYILLLVLMVRRLPRTREAHFARSGWSGALG